MSFANFDGLMQQKYNILGQQADAATLGAQAGMVGARAQAADVANRAQLYPAEAGYQRSMGQAALTNASTEAGKLPYYGAQADLAHAQSQFTNTQSGLMPNTVGAQLDVDRARAASLNLSNQLTQQNTFGRPSPTEADARSWQMLHPGMPLPKDFYARGTSEIQGHGDGTVDTVPAMLAPKEAVLNAGAAEHLGRDVIQALNAVGLMKMGMGGGMPPAKGSPQPTKDDRADKPGYAGGTSFVQGFGGAPGMPGYGGSYDAYVQSLQSQSAPQTPTANNVAMNMRAKLTGNGGATRVPPLTPGYASGTSDVIPGYDMASVDRRIAAGLGNGQPVFTPQMPSAPGTQSTPQPKPAAYAKGTAKVAPKDAKGAKGGSAPKAKAPQGAPSDTPADISQIDPKALLAALQMGQMGPQSQAQQGMGGGMPAPMGPPPGPMGP